MDKRGEDQDFLSKIFCLIVPKSFVGDPFNVSVFPGIKKFYASMGYVTNFCRNIFCLTVPKNLSGNPSVLCF